MPRVPPVTRVSGRCRRQVKHQAPRRERPPVVHPGDRRGAPAVSRTRATRKRYAAIPAAPCIQPTPGGSSGSALRCSTKRQQACGPSRRPARRARPPAAWRTPGRRRSPSALPGVEEHVADARRAAAAAVVVPEAGLQPLGQAGVADAVQAAALPAAGRLTRHLVDAGRARGPGTAATCRRRRGTSRRRTSVSASGGRARCSRHHEAAVAGVAEGDQVLGTTAGGVDAGPGARARLRPGRARRRCRRGRARSSASRRRLGTEPQRTRTASSARSARPRPRPAGRRRPARPGRGPGDPCRSAQSAPSSTLAGAERGVVDPGSGRTRGRPGSPGASPRRRPGRPAASTASSTPSAPSAISAPMSLTRPSK